MKRVFYPYWEWEDYQHGMWRKVPKNEELEYLEKAIKFTGDHALYGKYMMKVLSEYPKSCEQFLGNTNINRRAWIGHAACNIAINCPEYITRLAWKELSEKQRVLANREADKAIFEWGQQQEKDQLCFQF